MGQPGRSVRGAPVVMSVTDWSDAVQRSCGAPNTALGVGAAVPILSWWILLQAGPVQADPRASAALGRAGVPH
jgi:hypothetical protein